MASDFPVNDRFVCLLDGDATVTVEDSATLGGGNRLQVTLDLSIDALGAGGFLAGKAATADWQFTVDAAGLVTFTVRRSGGNASGVTTAVLALEPGRRYILEGVDDGETVTVYVNGVAGLTVGTVSTGAIVADAAALIVGGDLRMNLYALQVVRDDLTVLRLYVREQSGTTLEDTSGYGNNGTIAGTVFFGSDQSYEPVFPGLSTL